ncbi:Mov34/MPN/PAD-1 family protein [Paraburkholderia phenazinium]|uniref:Mov34/MPN/PAD-1 family protein n=1 Tax=Paraburkholderia phenazinium TaxID=60549 RepID=UPI000B870B3D|nr:Mov34/MPN/PAD-1 family protein [Paraburkholderia phenazinium]
MLRVTVPPEVRELLIAALRRAGHRECGGVLLGEHVGTNHFVVRSLTVHQTGAVATFVRRLGGVVKAIKMYCRSHGDNFGHFNYLGEWHSHPLFSVQPSPKDHSTMRELATDHRVGANFVVLLVFRLSGQQLEGSAHTYLPDGSVHLSNLDLEGIE